MEHHTYGNADDDGHQSDQEQRTTTTGARNADFYQTGHSGKTLVKTENPHTLGTQPLTEFFWILVYIDKCLHFSFQLLKMVKRSVSTRQLLPLWVCSVYFCWPDSWSWSTSVSVFSLALQPGNLAADTLLSCCCQIHSTAQEVRPRRVRMQELPFGADGWEQGYFSKTLRFKSSLQVEGFR